MRTDGQTDMTKLIVAFRNFENAPKNSNATTTTTTIDDDDDNALTKETPWHALSKDG
jgi:hypothetical protein